MVDVGLCLGASWEAKHDDLLLGQIHVGVKMSVYRLLFILTAVTLAGMLRALVSMCCCPSRGLMRASPPRHCARLSQGK